MARQKTIKPAQYEREIKVLELRRAGGTWDEIAQLVGYTDASAARKAYLRVTDRNLRETAEDVRDLELSRLDRLMAPYWGPATREGDKKAAELILKIMDRRARLMGLDAPQKSQVEVVTYDGNIDFDAEIDRLKQQLSIGGAHTVFPLQMEGGTSEAGATTA